MATVDIMQQAERLFAGLRREPDEVHLKDLFAGVGKARLVDLLLRHRDGNLTAAEQLALAVLCGREDAVQPLIDAAQEEFGQGQYRVPVRVVADWSRALIVATMPSEFSHSSSCDEMLHVLTATKKRLVAGAGSILTMPAGVKLDVYESAAGGVEVKPEGTE